MALIEAFLIFSILFLGATAILLATMKGTVAMWRLMFASQATELRSRRVRMTPASLTMIKSPTLRHG